MFIGCITRFTKYTSRGLQNSFLNHPGPMSPAPLSRFRTHTRPRLACGSWRPSPASPVSGYTDGKTNTIRYTWPAQEILPQISRVCGVVDPRARGSLLIHPGCYSITAPRAHGSWTIP